MIRSLLPQTLIDGKEKIQTSNGWLIAVFPVETSESGMSLVYQEYTPTEPSADDIERLKSKCLKEVKDEVLAKISAYDSSDSVNAFTLNGHTAWLDKATRVGLVNSVNTKISLGRDEITLWLGDISFTLPCANALAFLNGLEEYAMECYNKTAEHKANVLHSGDFYHIVSYNYTLGYPEKLNITI